MPDRDGGPTRAYSSNPVAIAGSGCCNSRVPLSRVTKQNRPEENKTRRDKARRLGPFSTSWLGTIQPAGRHLARLGSESGAATTTTATTTATTKHFSCSRTKTVSGAESELCCLSSSRPDSRTASSRNDQTLHSIASLEGLHEI